MSLLILFLTCICLSLVLSVFTFLTFQSTYFSLIFVSQMIIHYGFSFSVLLFAFSPVLLQPYDLSTPKSEFGPLRACDRDFFEINILS